jgi:hypothetical protein
MKKVIYVLLTLIISIVMIENANSQETKEISTENTINKDSEKLVVVWTSGDIDVAIKMVYMYTYNAKKNGWWKDVTFIIWGPSSKLLAENQELQDNLKKMKDEGIVLEACKACADMYGITDKLNELGIDVKYMGVALTDYLKSERHVITF